MRRFPFHLPALLALLLSLTLSLTLGLGLILAAPAVHAEALEAGLVKQYPAGSIQNVAQAKTALTAVTDTRKRVENEYAEARNACLEKFFMTRCFDSAKDRRRTALAAIRKIEVEASAYLRKEKADERDRGVAERQGKAAASAEGSAIPFTGATRSESAPDDSVPDDSVPGKQQDKP